MKRNSTGSPTRVQQQKQQQQKQCSHCSHHDVEDEKQRLLSYDPAATLQQNRVHALKVLAMIFVAFLLVGVVFDFMTAESPKKVARKKQLRGSHTALDTNAGASAVAVTPTLPVSNQQQNVGEQQPEDESWYTRADDETMDDDAALKAAREEDSADGSADGSGDGSGDNDIDDAVVSQNGENSESPQEKQDEEDSEDDKDEHKGPEAKDDSQDQPPEGKEEDESNDGGDSKDKDDSKDEDSKDEDSEDSNDENPLEDKE